MEDDIFTLQVLNHTLTYQVDQIKTVLPTEVDDLAITEGQDYCTLVTCTPYGVNSHRLLVRGHRIANLQDDVVVPADATRIDPYITGPIFGGAAVLLLLIWLIFSGISEKMHRRRIKKLLASLKHSSQIPVSMLAVTLIVTLAAALVTPTTAQAYQELDTTRKDCSITITYEAVGDSFHIIKVADVTQNVQFDMTKGSFKDYADRIDLKGLTSQQWNSTAITLAGYAVSDTQIRDDYTAVIPESKTVTIADMPTGLYLVYGDQIFYNGRNYTPGASMVCLPDSPDGDTWNYNPVIQPKQVDGQQEKEYKVRKVWKNDTANNRPSSIEVNIICNNEIVRTITLSKENNWSYSWKATGAGEEWNVSEKTNLKNYKVRVEQSETTFTITNTRDEEFPELPPGQVKGVWDDDDWKEHYPPDEYEYEYDENGKVIGAHLKVKTGDDTDLVTPVIWMIGSAGVIVVMLLIRRGQKRKYER